MTPNEFDAALEALNWKQADFCRKAGVERSTPRRWLSGTTDIPGWVPAYLEAMLEIQRLHKRFVLVEKTKRSDERGDLRDSDTLCS